jgi:hypothetical protein
MLHIRWNDWRAAFAAVALGSAALLVACGGGGGSDTATAGNSYAQGAIAGFGSVIVGGVRYDDSAATVSDEDGNASTGGALRLGMMVQVDAGAVDATAATAVARRIRFGNEIVGPVGTIDSAASTVLVLGQTVLVTASTVFDSTLSGGLSALTPGSVVEVHGILDTADNRIVATRIEAKAGATAYRLRGVVASLDATNKTFRIGSELISYAGLAAADVPAALADGLLVRVVLQTTQQAGAWVATKLRGGLRLPDASAAHVEGVITVYTAAANFEISGLPVDASSATFPDGRAGVVLGARVEVTGTVVNGVLVATKVEVQERRDGGHRALELHGTVGSLDAATKTFALRGVPVWYGGTVVYSHGTETDLANGARVQVHGVLSADRTRLGAQRIEFD